MFKIVKTEDGSNTLFSKKYNQHFHDIKIGAIKESLQKHVIPAFTFHKNSTKLKIVDICFGIGYNTFTSIDYIIKNNLDINIEIFSPELDSELVKSINNFEFPKEFEHLKDIIKAISKYQKYEDEKIKIEVFIGNARQYLKTLKNIDIVYQDAFSKDVNSELWSVEYFKDIYKAANSNCIITTYSIATSVRLSLFEAGFEIYEIDPTGKRKQTVALKTKKDFDGKYIDMNLKKIRNKEAKAIYDEK